MGGGCRAGERHAEEGAGSDGARDRARRARGRRQGGGDEGVHLTKMRRAVALGDGENSGGAFRRPGAMLISVSVSLATGI